MRKYKLKGIGIIPFTLKLDNFHGWYISILKISITYKKKESLCSLGGDYSLLYFGIHENENNSLICAIRLFFFIKIRFCIRPQKYLACKKCKTKVSEYEINENDFWCDGCGGILINKTEMETIIDKTIK